MYHNPQDQERPLVCLSYLLCLDLVSFPVLSQVRPQIPLLVVPFRQFQFKFQLCNYTTPGTLLWFPGVLPHLLWVVCSGLRGDCQMV